MIFRKYASLVSVSLLALTLLSSSASFGKTAVSADCAVAAGNDIAAGGDILINCGLTPDEVYDIMDRIQSKQSVPLTAYAEVSNKLGVTTAAVESFFRIVGEKLNPGDDAYLKLSEIARRYVDLLGQKNEIDTSDARVKVLVEQADMAIKEAKYDDADQLLAEAERLDFETARDRLRNSASTRYRRGQVSLTQFKYQEAAAHFGVAADRLPVEDHEKQIQYRLAEADAQMQYGDEKGDNEALSSAIEKYQALLDQIDRSSDKNLWAMTQNYLGNALRILGYRESGTQRLEQAVAAYRNALREYSRERVPLYWAETQGNLGNALRILGERESGTQRLEQAMAAYRYALQEQTRALVPLHWAMTQYNLGTALHTLGERESGTQRLEQALVAYRNALLERTRKREPLAWARTQNNLGIALRILGERESGTQRLEQAVTTHRNALLESTRERVPLEWARTQGNLGNALRILGERESGTQRLEQAVAAYRNALLEYTRERVPLDWAMTQNNLSMAFQTLGERSQAIGLLQEAEEAARNAYRVYALDAGYSYEEYFQNRIQAIQDSIDSVQK